ncbi:unnamed protein product [Cyclocybe aegerita]|uniref:Uncharacterized protein n=1 Tax=Cyclocybe aegerita TaxID=1973307 RepID=A0A8S0W0C3_CYCAE|nr:unnamed protein product [Cyclocybe aegerita]
MRPLLSSFACLWNDPPNVRIAVDLYRSHIVTPLEASVVEDDDALFLGQRKPHHIILYRNQYRSQIFSKAYFFRIRFERSLSPSFKRMQCIGAELKEEDLVSSDLSSRFNEYDESLTASALILRGPPLNTRTQLELRRSHIVVPLQASVVGGRKRSSILTTSSFFRDTHLEVDTNIGILGASFVPESDGRSRWQIGSLPRPQNCDPRGRANHAVCCSEGHRWSSPTCTALYTERLGGEGLVPVKTASSKASPTLLLREPPAVVYQSSFTPDACPPSPSPSSGGYVRSWNYFRFLILLSTWKKVRTASGCLTPPEQPPSLSCNTIEELPQGTTRRCYNGFSNSSYEYLT